MTRRLIKLQNLIFYSTILLVWWTITQAANRPFCPVALITGYPCPGCGLTRAGLLLSEGRFSDSFQAHPFFLPLMLLLAAWLFCYLFYPKGLSLLLKISVGLSVLFFAFYLYRMATKFPWEAPMTFYQDNLLGLPPFR